MWEYKIMDIREMEENGTIDYYLDLKKYKQRLQ